MSRKRFLPNDCNIINPLNEPTSENGSFPRFKIGRNLLTHPHQNEWKYVPRKVGGSSVSFMFLNVEKICHIHKMRLLRSCVKSSLLRPVLAFAQTADNSAADWFGTLRLPICLSERRAERRTVSRAPGVGTCATPRLLRAHHARLSAPPLSTGNPNLASIVVRISAFVLQEACNTSAFPLSL